MNCRLFDDLSISEFQTKIEKSACFIIWFTVVVFFLFISSLEKNLNGDKTCTSHTTTSNKKNERKTERKRRKHSTFIIVIIRQMLSISITTLTIRLFLLSLPPSLAPAFLLAAEKKLYYFPFIIDAIGGVCMLFYCYYYF